MDMWITNRTGDGAGSGGARVVGGIGREQSAPESQMETPNASANGPKATRNVRAVVMAVAARLTIRFLDVGAGVESKDPYVLNTTKAIKKERSSPFQMIAAIAYDNVMHKGKSAADVRSALLELVEEIDCWEAERDGQKITPPDLTPLLRLENRHEARENDSALNVAANPDSPAALAQYEKDCEAEIAVQAQAVQVARQRRVRLHRTPRQAAV